MSNDLGVTYRLIAADVINTGDYVWHVDASFATNFGLASADLALFLVSVVDQVGRGASDVSDSAFSIYDRVVPTMLRRFVASAVPGGVQLSWQFGDPAQLGAVSVERAALADGPWNTVDLHVQSDGEGTVGLDRDKSSGASQYYRLRVTWVNGQTDLYGPVPVTRGESIASSGLDRVGPTPSAGQPVRIEYWVAHETVVRLSVADLQGRLVELLCTGTQSPGRHQIAWTARFDVPSGIYFIRYEAEGRVMSRRIVVTN